MMFSEQTSDSLDFLLTLKGPISTQIKGCYLTIVSWTSFVHLQWVWSYIFADNIWPLGYVHFFTDMFIKRKACGMYLVQTLLCSITKWLTQFLIKVIDRHRNKSLSFLICQEKVTNSCSFLLLHFSLVAWLAEFERCCIAQVRRCSE